jgi:hypothetical protein
VQAKFHIAFIIQLLKVIEMVAHPRSAMDSLPVVHGYRQFFLQIGLIIFLIGLFFS